MDWNPGYLLQQLLMAGGAALFASPLVLLSLPLRRNPVGRSLVELPVVALWLGFVGLRCYEFGLSDLLRPIGGMVIPPFIAIALVFYWVAVWWPLLIVLRRKRLTGGPGRVVKSLAFVGVAVSVWATMIEPDLLERDHRTIVLPDLGHRTLKIAHVTDLQSIGFGRRVADLVAALREFAPDMIVFTGDYITPVIRQDICIAGVRRVFAQLSAPLGIYATTSDSDTEPERRELFADLGITYLLNKSAVVEWQGLKIRVGGVNHFMPRWARIRGDATDDELFVVACHSPDLAEEAKARMPQADLYLCGHTHGGQLQVPGYGPLLTFSRVPREVAAGGIFETSNGMPFALSRGVGMQGAYAPRFRLNCRPHVFLLTLKGNDG